MSHLMEPSLDLDTRVLPSGLMPTQAVSIRCSSSGLLHSSVIKSHNLMMTKVGRGGGGAGEERDGWASQGIRVVRYT